MEWLMQLGDGVMLGVDRDMVQAVNTGYPYPDVPGGQMARMCAVLESDDVPMGYLMQAVKKLPLPMHFSEFVLRLKSGGSGDSVTDLHMALADLATGGVACVDKDLLSRRLMYDISGLTEYMGNGYFKLSLPYLGVAYGKNVRGFRGEFDGYLRPAKVVSASGNDVVLSLEGIVQPDLYDLVYTALTKNGVYKGKRIRFTKVLRDYFMGTEIPSELQEYVGKWSSGHCNVVTPVVDIISYYCRWKDQMVAADVVTVDLGGSPLDLLWQQYSLIEFVHNNSQDILFMFWYYMYSKFKVFAQGISVEADNTQIVFRCSGRTEC